MALFLSTNIFFGGSDGPQAFNQYIDILKSLLILNTFLNGNLKDCLMKVLNRLTPLIDYYGYSITVKFNGSILRQPKISYTYEKK